MQHPYRRGLQIPKFPVFMPLTIANSSTLHSCPPNNVSNKGCSVTIGFDLLFHPAGRNRRGVHDQSSTQGRTARFSKGEHGTLSSLMRRGQLDLTFPATRAFTATKQGDRSTYHYTVVRASEESLEIATRLANHVGRRSCRGIRRSVRR